MDDVRLAELLGRIEAIDVSLRERRLSGLRVPDIRMPAAGLREAAERRAHAEALAHLDPRAVLDKERKRLVAELARGLPPDTWVRNPLHPRQALIASTDPSGEPTLAEGPWRVARGAPPGSPPEAVYEADRALRDNLLTRAGRFARSATAAFVLLTVPDLVFGADTTFRQATSQLDGPSPEFDALMLIVLWVLPPVLGCWAGLVAWSNAIFLWVALDRYFFHPAREISRAWHELVGVDPRSHNPASQKTNPGRGAAPEGRTAPRQSQIQER